MQSYSDASYPELASDSVGLGAQSHETAPTFDPLMSVASPGDLPYFWLIVCKSRVPKTPPFSGSVI